MPGKPQKMPGSKFVGWQNLGMPQMKPSSALPAISLLNIVFLKSFPSFYTKLVKSLFFSQKIIAFFFIFH